MITFLFRESLPLRVVTESIEKAIYRPERSHWQFNWTSNSLGGYRIGTLVGGSDQLYDTRFSLRTIEIGVGHTADSGLKMFPDPVEVQEFGEAWAEAIRFENRIFHEKSRFKTELKIWFGSEGLIDEAPEKTQARIAAQMRYDGLIQGSTMFVIKTRDTGFGSSIAPVSAHSLYPPVITKAFQRLRV